MTARQDFFSRLLRDRSGNFGMMTAILLPVLVGGAGIALDLTNMMMSKTQMQEAADSAALAASTALASGKATDEAAARKLAQDFFIAQMANYMGGDAASKLAGSTQIAVNTTTSGKGTNYKVAVSSSYDLALSPFMGVFGYKTMDIGVSSTSTSGKSMQETALSMALVLDQSGSMDWNTTTVESQTCTKKTKRGKCTEWSTTYVKKITALKAAAKALFDSLDEADPDGKLTRTGAVSYTHEVVDQTSPFMDWGTSAARNFALELPDKPAGGTDASGAMVIADNGVKKLPDGSDKETIEHAEEGSSKVERFIVLMTDGEMTGDSNKWNPGIDQDVRDTCNAAKASGTRLFTVAFMAPEKGKSLLRYCATTESDYYEPETMEQLVSDFSEIARNAVKAKTVLTN